jgi:elongation factor Ts
MTDISAAQVKQLRDLTGAGMMDCKRALEETGGDMEAARKLLRERGMAAAGQRTGKTTEGKVGYRIADDRSRGTMVAVGCESEQASGTPEFLAFAEKVLDAVEADGPGAEERLEEERLALVASIRENVTVVDRVRFEAVEGGLIEGYAHAPANKFGALVHLRGGSPELARQIAMHVVAANPQWIGREDVPEDVVAAEREIYANSDEVRSKPEQAREKIVEGMLGKRFFAAQVLVDQPWIHDTAKAVGQMLSEQGTEVLEFARLAFDK